MRGAGEELVLQILQCLQGGVHDVTPVLLEDVEPLEHVAVYLVERLLGRLEGGPCLQVPLVCWGVVAPLNVLKLFFCSVELAQRPSSYIKAYLEIPVVRDVVLHRSQNVEVHVALQLCNGAVRRVRTGDLIRGLLQLAAVGGDQVFARRLRHALGDTLRQRNHARGQLVDTSHKVVNLLVDVVHRIVEGTKITYHALEHRIHVLTDEPLLLHDAPFHPDAVDVVLEVVHDLASHLAKCQAPLAAVGRKHRRPSTSHRLALHRSSSPAQLQGRVHGRAERAQLHRVALRRPRPGHAAIPPPGRGQLCRLPTS
mmetsp:Transcript_95077/g.245632  ORF Transcript_95077/g.245632 Transcript_95077/m.245632 type:complete len:311 (+) Transcript_95077:1355-2287(+)